MDTANPLILETIKADTSLNLCNGYKTVSSGQIPTSPCLLHSENKDVEMQCAITTRYRDAQNRLLW